MNSNPLVEQLGWTLLHTLWQGVVVAAALAATLRVLRRATASTRYGASCAALAIVIAAAVVTLFAIRQTPHIADAPKRVATAPNARPIGSTVAMPVSVADPIITPSSDLLRITVIVWGAGVAAMAVWHAGGWLWLVRLRKGVPIAQWQENLAKLMERLNVRRAVRLIETSAIDVPAVVGVLRPVILVPIGVFSGLSPQQVEAILAHELAHVRRHDYLINLIQAAVESLMFYHPAVWWISSRIRCERENCCDDIAASVCGDAKDYASALVELEQRRTRRFGAMLAMSATGGNLLSRIRRLLNLPPASPPRMMRIRSLAAAVLALACVAAPLAVLAQEHKSEAPTTDAARAVTLTDKPSPIEPDDLKAVVEDYRIGPNDLVNVSITDLVAAGVETVKSCRVSNTGNITLPYLGVMKVAGLTETEAEAAIAKGYKDKNIIDKPQVAVTIAEQRGRTFSIIGSVDRPGQYQIPQSDFRVLDALATCSGRPSEISTLYVIRAAVAGKEQRVLKIPMERLASGDLSVNVVIRPGDMLIAASREKKFAKVVIGKEMLLYQGKPIDIAALKRMFDDMSEGERHNTVLEVAAAAPDVTVERFFNASGQLSELVKQYKLAYLSETGIHPTTEPGGTQRNDGGDLETLKRQRAAIEMELARSKEKLGPDHPVVVTLKRMAASADEKIAALRAAEEATMGEYYIDGAVSRRGVYSLTGRKVTLKQAIAAAGGLNQVADAFVTVVRRTDDKEEVVLANARYSDLLSGKQRDLYLHANDVVKLTEKPMPSPTTQQAPLP